MYTRRDPGVRVGETKPTPPALKAIAFVLLLTAAAASTTTASVEYEFLLVEALDPNYNLREVYMRDINEAEVACGTSTYQSSYAGFYWTDAGGKQILPITWTRGINSLNQVVGDNLVYDIATGQSTVIPPAGSWPLTRVHGINDLGIVVGFAECSCSNSEGVLQSALIWDPTNGSRTTGISAARELLRINNNNVAVGNIRPSAGSSEAFIYDVNTGMHTNLSDLLPPPPFVRPWSEGADINIAGEVCGQAYDGSTVTGMVWSPLSGFTYLPGLDGGDPTRVFPMGMNDDGVVVGRALSGTSGDWDAFIWDPVNGMRNLDLLVDAPMAFTLDWAVEINENGWIVGIGHFGPGWGTSRGFVLRPLAITTAAGDAGPVPGAPSLRIVRNPVRGRLDLQFAAPSASAARLSVYDVQGREVARLVEGSVGAGRHTISWNPMAAPSGVYYTRLELSGRVRSERFVLLR